KEINEDIKWKRKPQNGLIYEFTVPLDLINGEQQRLLLIVNRNTKIRKFSFTIVWNGHRIKSLDIGKDHKNPPFNKENRVGKKHKHTWTDKWRDVWAYKPDDITDGADFTQILNEFFIECNIKCNVNIPKVPPAQEELMFDEELYGNHGVY